ASRTSVQDGRQVKFLFLREGEDQDTLVRQVGSEKFERMIDLAVPLEDFLFDAVAEGINTRTMEGRANFSRRAAPLLDKLPKGVFRELMFENLATRTGLSRNVLQDLINAPVTQPEPQQAPAIKPEASHTPQTDNKANAPHADVEYGDYGYEPNDYQEQDAP